MGKKPAGAKRFHVYYSGRVQGVGFRYTVRSLAGQFEVTGFVRNISDGRVELIVEGDESEVYRLLESIQVEMGHYIQNYQQNVSEATGQFEDFGIAF